MRLKISKLPKWKTKRPTPGSTILLYQDCFTPILVDVLPNGELMYDGMHFVANNDDIWIEIPDEYSDETNDALKLYIKNNPIT